VSSSKRLDAPVGVLASGGLDSSILVGHLLAKGWRVQPFYIATGLAWQAAELAGLRAFLEAIGQSAIRSESGHITDASGYQATGQLLSLVVLELPLGDLYSKHWSMTGHQVPDARSPDEAVYLPGRNALLIVKAAVWCQLNGIGQLALAPLGTSPFGDASPDFFREFQSAINRGSPHAVQLLRPFGEVAKQEVMQLGPDMPLELTFSCIDPVPLAEQVPHSAAGLHCGRCNKCAERQAAFQEAGLEDRTAYASHSHVPRLPRN
jgi:7-cyano-7-deazaguanine synthase